MRTARQVAARRWLVATMTPGLLLVAGAGWLAGQLGSVLLGVSQTTAGDHAAAEGSFSAAERIGVVERWVAPFDRGVALYHQGQWDAASSSFERAAALAPSQSQCRVRLNWAWSLEAAAKGAGDDPVSSLARLQQAQFILAAAPCQADDAAPTDAEGKSGELEQQWNDTRERIDSESSAQPTEAPDDPVVPKDNSEELANREQQAQEQRQQALDEATREESDDGQKNW